MSNTLLLSQGYLPIATISWQRAITLLFQDKVEVIEEYDGKDLHSTSIHFKMPAVVRLINKIRRSKKQHIKFSRANIYTRDGWKCQYCGKKGKSSDLNLDHVTPRSKGGKTCWENIVTSCIECNNKKKDKSPTQAGMKLRKRPYTPTWLPMFSIQFKGSIPDQWTSYIYWNTELGD